MPNPANRIVVHLGTVRMTIRLLRWWAESADAIEPALYEGVMQSRECARDLLRDVRHPKRFRFVKRRPRRRKESP